jgi:hypothetical protein
VTFLVGSGALQSHSWAYKKFAQQQALHNMTFCRWFAEQALGFNMKVALETGVEAHWRMATCRRRRMPSFNICPSVQEVLVLFMHVICNVPKYAPRKYKTFTNLTMSTILHCSDVVFLVVQVDRKNTSMEIARNTDHI